MENLDFIQLNQDEDLYSSLENITGDYAGFINQEEYNKQYQERLNEFDNNGKLHFDSNSSIDQSVLLPKYDKE
ncbi:hypothetical protein [Clostridium perfringens]|uniref:Uncharacterized protein n=1 Tax=Clostridium perfringens TaxID=1502 RepID=X5HZI5_CLOPF|nr:hypothetical protein [Clostridium perfringens]EHK2364647.1 hypothetical protein [Clostridium perfringens]EJT5928900.1 hypothetical protein [Clostridium perfringens]EJT6172314.1 hypothetical protein [Clostridium perfringens]EJT6342325.1 hypothetical protein [Clostridium perfringens]EJT6483482.1 hypothetical protein [Clostridium perfringens]